MVRSASVHPDLVLSEKQILHTVMHIEQKAFLVYVFQQQHPKHSLVSTEGDKF